MKVLLTIIMMSFLVACSTEDSGGSSSSSSKSVLTTELDKQIAANEWCSQEIVDQNTMERYYERYHFRSDGKIIYKQMNTQTNSVMSNDSGTWSATESKLTIKNKNGTNSYNAQVQNYYLIVQGQNTSYFQECRQ